MICLGVHDRQSRAQAAAALRSNHPTCVTACVGGFTHETLR
jgi:hypothetical protein